MHTHEIFAAMPAASAAEIFGYLHGEEKQLYKAAIDSLAKQRKLRPVFVERKPRPERWTWMQSALGRPQNDGVAAHLLQIWLVGKHADLLCAFLDGLGIAHDDNGTVETLPDAPPREDLQRVTDDLLAQFDREHVAIYLHAFQATHDEGGWPGLGAILAEDDRLRLAPSAAA